MNTLLADRINELNGEMKKKIPKAVRLIMQRAMQKIIASDIENKALKTGDRVPLFTLDNAFGKKIALEEMLAKKAAVIAFYRGHWCPYCSLELQALQGALPHIEASGGRLVAISPNLPDKSLLTQRQYNLKYEVLSDIGNNVSRMFGIVFKLPGELMPIYKAFGIDLIASNGDDSYELPLPATYVADKTGVIKYAFVNPDYTKRAEPSAVISVLKEIKKGT